MKLFLSRLPIFYGLVALLVITFATTAVGVQITTTNLPTGVVGQAYRINLTANEGQPPFSWDIIENTLPPGLNFNFDEAFGYISGIPTANGAYYFTVQVTDSDLQTATKAFSLP